MNQNNDPYAGLKTRIFIYLFIFLIGLAVIFFLENKIDYIFANITKVRNERVIQENQ